MTGLVIRREVRERLREKAFAGSTVINIAIIVAVVIIASLVGGDEESYTVGYSTETELAVLEAAAARLHLDRAGLIRAAALGLADLVLASAPPLVLLAEPEALLRRMAARVASGRAREAAEEAR